MENWKPIPSWEDFYEVSDQGQVRSLDRTVIDRNGRQMKYKGKSLKWQNLGQGYPSVTLYQSGKQRTRLVHTLVAKAFIGPYPEGMECCHNDGNRWNPALSNIRYDTRSGNHADKIQHGTSAQGENHPHSKLTVDNIRLIRNSEDTCVSLAKKLGVTFQTISKIRLQKAWSHIS